jgi:hypothetical protein
LYPGDLRTGHCWASRQSGLAPGKTPRWTDSRFDVAKSRGIANIQLIIKAIVDYVKRFGAEPFIVPAMGSHGGGTATDDSRILRNHRGVLRMPDPLDHGDGHQLRSREGLFGPLRQVRISPER